MCITQSMWFIWQYNMLTLDKGALCNIHYALCNMHYALCTMHYALCTMHYALCTMHYTMHYEPKWHTSIEYIFSPYIHTHVFTKSL